MEQNSKQVTILAVDDTPANIDVVKEVISKEYLVMGALSGAMALKIIERKRPDLILLDIQLPVLSGYEVAERLKAEDRLRHIPVIAITSYALSGDHDKALAAGCDDYIAKPYKPQELMDCLARHLESASSSDDD